MIGSLKDTGLKGFCMKRSSGILMPLYSLPSPYGIGTMGRCAYEFVDFLAASGQKYWQLLPLGHTDHGNSPYSSPSSFAGNPFLIDLDMLIEDGLIALSDVDGVNWGEDPETVDYPAIRGHRMTVLRTAFNNCGERFAEERDSFYNENRRWLSDYALFMALKDRFGGSPWFSWPDDIRRRDPDAVERCSRYLKTEIDFYVFVQFLFFRQWDMLQSYAHGKGISFIGDLPIYVAMDSADLWSEPWFFQLDGDLQPLALSGAPPDGFSPDGQLWGNPLYDYDKMRDDGFGWWIRRMEGAWRLYDVVRIDHFRGFESYWSVPVNASSAKAGEWKKGPGMALVGVLTSWFNTHDYIAEDLGYITPEVTSLLEESGLRGMKVLQFAFDPDGDSRYLPHNIEKNSVCYVGTHDNDTILGWAEDSDPETVEYARRYMGINGSEGWCHGFIRTGMASASDLFIMTMQDILQLPGYARTNVPGVAEGNWKWRMRADALSGELASRLYDMTHVYRRV